MGLAAAIGGGISSALGLGLGDLGAGVLGGSLLGAGTGAAESAITGGNPLLGALTGGATGGLTPLGGAALTDLGIPASIAGPLAGGAIGAGASGITGGNPLLGAVGGAAGPLLSDVAGATGLSGLFSGGSTGGTSTGGDYGGGSDFSTTSPATGTTPLTTPTGIAPTPTIAATGPAPVAGGLSAAGGAVPASVPISDPLSTGILDTASVSGLPSSIASEGPFTLLSGGTGTTGTPGLNPAGDFTSSDYGGGGDFGSTNLGTALGGTGGNSPSFSSVLGSGSLNTNPGAYVAASPSEQVAADVAADPTGTGSSSSGGFLSNLFGGSSSSGSSGSSGLGGLLKSPGLLLGAGLIGLDKLMQPSLPSVGSSIGPIQGAAGSLGATGTALTTAGIPSLESQAQAFSTQGSQLAGYLQTGTLPPGVQASLDQAANEAKAATISRYASMGGGAETSSAAARDIANIDQQEQAQGAQIAANLLSQGVSEEQLASQIYNTLLSSGLGATGESAQLYSGLLNTTLQQDAQLGQSIAAFASALVPRTVTTTTPSTTTG